MILTFGIERWDAWMPGVRTPEHWSQFIRQPGYNLADEEHSEDYLCLTSRQRRRLSRLSKVTLDVALGAQGDIEPMPSVFASRRGEVGRMAELLQDICRGDDLSPTAFSLSVHNTASGLYTIQSHSQQPSTAIAAGHDTVISALIESCAQLANGHPNILLVISEETMPDIYSCFASEAEQTMAAAFILSATDEYQMTIEPVLSGAEEVEHRSTAWQVVQLMSSVLSGQESIITGERLSCRILPWQ